jgi:putative N6-adenine-specific DNA methylase
VTERYFAPCPRGLEAALAAELTRIAATDVTIADGGVGFAGGLDLACRANLESRIASRVLWRVGGGPYRDEHALYDLVKAIDWKALFASTRTLRVDIAAKRSPLQSLEFATLRVKDAICDRLRDDTGVRPSIDKRQPEVRVAVYLTDRDATVYLDTSGEPLFKRGYRRDTDEAPLRENLAAGLLALTGWTPGVPFLDPMCGSGTIAVEAALIAADRAPGLARTFGFQKLAWFDGPAWQRMKQTARDRVRTAPAVPTLFASDLAPDAVAKAQSNLRAAQVDAFVAVETADFLARPAPAPNGVLLANPPYGVRLDDLEKVARFYPLAGDALKQHFAGWTAYFFTGDLRLPKLIHLKVTRKTPLFNGALECRLFEFPIVAGRHAPAA